MDCLKWISRVHSWTDLRRNVRTVFARGLDPRPPVMVTILFGLVFVWFSYRQLTVSQSIKNHQTQPTDRIDRNILFLGTLRRPTTHVNVSERRCQPWAIRNNPAVILAYVQSSSLKTQRRYLIRKTWGRRWKFGIQPLFVIGRHDIHVEYPESLLDLERENCEFGDILYIPDVTDHSDNLTLMEIRGKIWIMEHVPRTRYVLKVDDGFSINETLWMSESKALLNALSEDPGCSNHNVTCTACQLFRNLSLTGLMEDWAPCAS